MIKEEIANVLERIATLLELKNENPFKVRAYTNAARAIETFGGNVSNFQDEEAVAKIPGIGKSGILRILFFNFSMISGEGRLIFASVAFGSTLKGLP